MNGSAVSDVFNHEGNEGPWSDFKYFHVTNADSARCVTNIESWLANL